MADDTVSMKEYVDAGFSTRDLATKVSLDSINQRMHDHNGLLATMQSNNSAFVKREEFDSHDLRLRSLEVKLFGFLGFISFLVIAATLYLSWSKQSSIQYVPVPPQVTSK